jgi:hypothetical protein
VGTLTVSYGGLNDGAALWRKVITATLMLLYGTYGELGWLQEREWLAESCAMSAM